MVQRFFFAVLSLIFLVADWGQAADCQLLHDQIKQERALIKRRQLCADAVGQCPGNADLHFEYGFTLERLRQYREALEQYEATVAIDPEQAKAYFNMGDVLRLREELDKAILMYRKGLAIEPDNSRALKRLQELEGQGGAVQ